MRWINRQPQPALRALLVALPFALVAVAYMTASAARLAENPQDRILPAPSTLASTAWRLMTEEDRRSGEVVFWLDTLSSLGLLGAGVGIAALLGLAFGIAIGLIPYIRTTLSSFVAVISMIPPLSILPILFIMLGLGATAKIALIVIGIGPFLIRDMAQRVIDLPPEQFVKAQTLGASSTAIALRVVVPQLIPRLIGSVRLALGPAWLFLIAAEAIASEQGLGYRIFLVRRFLAMDIILVYVAWITLLAFLFDYALRQISRRAFPWDGDAL
ncbi:MAG: ABC transporter permease subunit [Pseudomonadota bacterium]